MEHVISMATTSNGTKHKAADNSREAAYYRCSPCYLKFLLKESHWRTLHFCVNWKYKTQCSD